MKTQLYGCLLLVYIVTTTVFSPAKASEPLQVMVSIRPQLYVVQQLGGEFVNVSSLLPKGAFPGVYEPTSKQMRDLSHVDVYIRIKVPYEIAWWEKIKATNPDMYVIDSTEGVGYIDEHREKGADHHGRDPHIWLSTRQVRIQAENIYQGLITVDPGHTASYTAKKEAFLTLLDSLDATIQTQLSDLKTRKFMIFHPAWSYFARDYNLEQIPIEIEGKEPSVKEMAAFIKLAQKEHITVLFVQPQTSLRSVNTIAKQIGARVEILDPLAADWKENLLHVTKILAEALSK